MSEPSDCEHSFVFLRQDRTNIGYDRNPRWLYEDVFYCQHCLTHRRVKVKETVNSRDHFGEDTVWTAP